MSDDAVDFSGPPICMVGNLNRDVKVTGVPGNSSTLLDGETSVPPIIETIGGGGANSACAAAALGADVRFIGKVGADPLGDRLRGTLETQGVHTSLARATGVVTGSTVALGFTSGHRHFLSCLPNNETLAFEDLDLRTLEGCTHLLRADVWFSESMLDYGNKQLLAEARRRGLATSLDINYDPCWSSGPSARIARRKEQLRAVLPLVDLAHGNVKELQEFTDTSDLQSALEKVTAWGVRAVVVHLGSRGAGYFSQSEWVTEAPDLAENPVHSTGTGDVLSICMVLLHHRKDLSVREKLRISNRVVREFMEGKRSLIPMLQA